MITTVITSKGTTTIPKEVRGRLNLRPGSKINFKEERGRIYIERALTLEEVRDANVQLIDADLLKLSFEEIKEQTDKIRGKELKEKYRG